MSTLVPVSDLKVLSMGEVLWDIVGSKKLMGGAPFNFAYHAKAFGAQANVITRVGRDDLGTTIVQKAEQLGLMTEFIQLDPAHPTGTVVATLDDSGNATYDISKGVAWDFLEFTDGCRPLVDEADIFCFGSLAQRTHDARAAVLAALAAVRDSSLIVFDMNLRPPYFDESIIKASLQESDMVKLNEDELKLLRPILGLPEREKDAVEVLMRKYDIATLVLTHGARGAEAWDGADYDFVEGYEVEVVDTIGSGDAFCAMFATQMSAGSNLRNALRKANLAGAYVATQVGGTPQISIDRLMNFERGNELESARK